MNIERGNSENELTYPFGERGDTREDVLQINYPTPQELRTALRRHDISGRDVYLNLPIYEPQSKQAGYRQFLTLVEKKRELRERTKHSIKSSLRRIGTVLFEEDPTTIRTEQLDMPAILKERVNPFIEIGGPTFGWTYKNSPQPVVMVDEYPWRGAEFILKAEAMPFPEESIGAIFASYVPEILDDEIYRVLEPGGVFVQRNDSYRDPIIRRREEIPSST